MKNYRRTDLACESDAAANGAVRQYELYGIRVEELEVAPGAPESSGTSGPGRYATIHCGRIWEMDRRETGRAARAAERVLRDFLTHALGRPADVSTGVLVAGLGNRFITPDSVGPRTADRITVTNHAAGEGTLLAVLGCPRVCALAPGVLGQTGMEAAALIEEAAGAVGADVIVAVDALAARSSERLASTVQISDAGIRPGSGIGNCRAAITRETMGVPVIALGVPTVVDSSTLVWDVLEEAGITEPDERLTRILEDGRRFIVSPRDSDRIAEAVSALLGQAINHALTPALQE